MPGALISTVNWTSLWWLFYPLLMYHAGGYLGCGHGHKGHPGRPHWSCCGKFTEKSECTWTGGQSTPRSLLRTVALWWPLGYGPQTLNNFLKKLIELKTKCLILHSYVPLLCDLPDCVHGWLSPRGHHYLSLNRLAVLFLHQRRFPFLLYGHGGSYAIGT